MQRTAGGLQGMQRGPQGVCRGLQWGLLGPPGGLLEPPGTLRGPGGDNFYDFLRFGRPLGPPAVLGMQKHEHAFMTNYKSTCIGTQKGSRGGFPEPHGAHKVVFSLRNKDISKYTHYDIILHLRGTSRRARWGPGPHTGRRWEPQKCRCAPFPRFRRPLLLFVYRFL